MSGLIGLNRRQFLVASTAALGAGITELEADNTRERKDLSQPEEKANIVVSGDIPKGAWL